MATTMTGQPQVRTEVRDVAWREPADGVPSAVDWRDESTRALAPAQLGLDADGRIIRIGGAPTGFVLDPLVGGRLVYVRDEFGTRYWLGSPGHLQAVVHWLVS